MFSRQKKHKRSQMNEFKSKMGQKHQTEKYTAKVQACVPVYVPFRHWQERHLEKYMRYSHSRVHDHALPRLKSSREKHDHVDDVHASVHLGL